MGHFAHTDDELEKRGHVLIVCNTSPVLFENFKPRLAKMVAKTEDVLPYKTGAVHFCFQNKLFRHFASFILALSGSDVRARVKMHHGKHILGFFV